MNKRLLSIATATTLAAGLAASAFAAPAYAAPKAPAKVTLSYFNAIPHVAVDVYVNNRKVANDLQPGQFTKSPIIVSASKNEMVRVMESHTHLKESAFLWHKFTFKAGGNYSIVGHRTNPVVSRNRFTLDSYKNDLSRTKSGQGRVTVRHVAAASPVDVLVNGKVAIKSLTNPGEAKAVLPASTYNVDVTLAYNDTSPVLSAKLPVTASENTIVYAWGDFRDNTLALATTTVALHK